MLNYYSLSKRLDLFYVGLYTTSEHMRLPGVVSLIRVVCGLLETAFPNKQAAHLHSFPLNAIAAFNLSMSVVVFVISPLSISSIRYLSLM